MVILNVVVSVAQYFGRDKECYVRYDFDKEVVLL